MTINGQIQGGATPTTAHRAKRARFAPFLLLPAIGAVSVTACGDEFSSCEARKRCPAGGAGGTAGGSPHAGVGGVGVDQYTGSGGASAGATASGGSVGRGGAFQTGGVLTIEGGASGSGAEGHSVGGRPAARVCGDGNVDPGEACDDGADNGLGLLRCAPDCSTIIQVKHILLAERELIGTNQTPNPVAAADASCKVGYKALFAYSNVRRATTIPFKVANAVDWVIKPYTYYYNARENPVWLTDAVALLGIRNGQFSVFENTVSNATAYAITGLNPDYTTLGFDNCNGWSSVRDSFLVRRGVVSGKDASFVLFEDGTAPCGNFNITFYCVEQ